MAPLLFLTLSLSGPAPEGSIGCIHCVGSDQGTDTGVINGARHLGIAWAVLRLP